MFSQEQIEGLVELNQYRRDSYLLNSRVFASEVDDVLWDILLGNRPAGGGGDDDLSRGLALLEAYLSDPGHGPDSLLKADYVNVFIGFGSTHAGAFPYESYYTSTKRILMQGAYDEMCEILKDEGIRPAAVDLSPHDHVSTELSLLAHYAQQMVDALGDGDETRYLALEGRYAEFLSNHPLKWMYRFCDDILRIADTDFYRAFAYILRGLLDVERELLEG